jgi:hypothetical protein
MVGIIDWTNVQKIELLKMPRSMRGSMDEEVGASSKTEIWHNWEAPSPIIVLSPEP